MFRRASKTVKVNQDSPSEGLGSALSDMSCNSPSGPLRVSKSKKGMNRSS